MENYSIEEFEAIVQGALEEFEIDFDIPVRINSRISRALGRCNISNVGDDTMDACLELSQRFVEQAPFEEIRQVLLHEAAHFIEVLWLGCKTGHDGIFRAICEYLGCEGDTSYIHTTMHMKYEAVCPRCGTLCYSASRKTKKWEWFKRGTRECGECGLSSDQWTYKIN